MDEIYVCLTYEQLMGCVLLSFFLVLFCSYLWAWGHYTYFSYQLEKNKRDSIPQKPIS